MAQGYAKLLSGMALIAAMAVGISTGSAADPIKLRFSTPAPPSEILSDAMRRFKATLKEKAPDDFDVSVHPGGSLFRQGTEIQAMQRGNLEMNTLATFEVPSFVKKLSVYNAGYLFRDYDHTQAVWNGPIGAAYGDAVIEGMGVRILANCYLGTRQVNIGEVRNVKTPADLAGIKLRMPGSPDFLLLGRGLGIIPTRMAMSEVYLAVKNGTVDGQDNPLTITRAAKMDEVTKEVVLTAHLVQTVFFAIAEPIYQKMSAAQQVLVTDAAVEACGWNDAKRLVDEKNQIAYFKSQGIVISEPDKEAFSKAMWALYEREGKTKEWSADAIEAVRNAR